MYKVISVDENKFLFEGANLKQSKLTVKDVYVIDDSRYIYVWFGKSVPNEVYKSLFYIGDAYKSTVGEPSKDLSVLGFKQGFEPKQFKTLFPKWNTDLIPDETEKTEMLRTNEI